ncbi:prominin-1-A isoform X8 [Rhinichthys klamathensis goyatoka]|uniref:prominin-1-A isoform X8 n=1 Tax=Rhinichthys klamathensis goyatoka TaxID=3034132 RepID=UPI0024B4C395|nr:prominin-1-A isoform X8 [Rhinichthys klamathensis goyatoka]XP_056113231.1 prominin-1-A isoform X8 [Rhinichthys klamathensis goyatoka]XP_056113232.1 prominin-1-A isoform X8 [Rhinichthys klamathensis goyatoka]
MLWKTGLIILCWGLSSGELQDGQSGTPATPARRTLDFGFVPSGVYDTVAYYEPGAIGILFNMMHAFLYVVQPNPFPEDLVIRVAKDKFGAIQSEYQKPENIVLTLQVIYYEIGFVVCAALGLLFTVLLPLVGLLFCLCRCCDNCGGEMHQRQRKNADCLRGLLTTLLLTTTFIITAGVLCAYAANQNLSSQLKSVRRLVKSNLRDLHTFANQTPAQIDYLISQYGTVKHHVLYDLENVGLLLGGRIHEELGKDVQPSLDAALSMTGIKVEKAIKAMRDTKDALENVNLTLETLQEGTVKLQANLSLVRGSLSNVLNDPLCKDVRSSEICRNILITLPRLEIAANYSSLPDVTEQLDKVNEVLKTDLSQIVEKGFTSFNDTPTMVTDQTRNIVEGVKVLLEDIGSNITTFTKLFPVHSSLTNFTKMITHTHSQIEDIYPQIDQMDFYRWICCITLCCMVVLILAFNFLGLLCGILGFDRHASPTTRGCVSNTGGNLLMAGVGFSFLFSWVLMGVITALFLAGGNLEKLVCEPFQTRQLFKVLDTPNLVNSAWRNFIPGYLYNDPEIDLTAYSLYSNCKDNRGIYSALHLDKIFNISAFFNTSVYSKDVSKKFEGMKVDLRGIILLESEGKQNLISFTETGINDIDFAAYSEEVNKGVTRVNLVDFASQLDAQADLLSKGTLQTSLKGHANTIRQIHIQQVIPLEQSMKYVKARSTLNQSIRLLERTSSDLPLRVRDVLEAVDAAQFLISHNATFLINQETEKYKQTIIGYFKQYMDWIRTSLALEVATCKPLSNIVDTAEILGCSFLLDSMNTFWFGLGCSSLFLLPSIILSIKLAKFYRRMDTEDVYDDSSVSGTWHFTL